MDALKRHLTAKINRLLASFPVVVILGARQCGKSTLAQMIGKNWDYVDLENPVHYQRVSDDPVLFFKQHNHHLIIDEAQKSPQLFEVLRGVVDAERQLKGRFLLTGSAHFELLKQVSESLAGRVAIVELGNLKVSERESKRLSNFYDIFASPLSVETLTRLSRLQPSFDVHDVNRSLLEGGYPEPVLSADQAFRLDWMENYFDTYINRDMRTLFPRIDIVKYRRVVAMLSALSGTMINRSEISRSIEASEKTCRDYMDIIKGTYFWRDLPAFRTPKIKTTSKLPKGHFRDSGLLLFLQNIYTSEQLINYPRLGNVFESFVVEELIKGIQTTSARNLVFSHFRTKAGGEIDLIAEGSFGLLPIEVKYQSNTGKRQIQSLENFIKMHQLPLGIVINNCESPAFITEKIIQIPVGCI